MADSTGSQNLLGSIIKSAFEFATPFAQKVLGQTSTPQQVQSERITNSALNGSGPDDPTLAKQSPLSLLDFITGARVTGDSSQGTSGLRSEPRPSMVTMFAIAAVAVIAAFMLLKK